MLVGVPPGLRWAVVLGDTTRPLLPYLRRRMAAKADSLMKTVQCAVCVVIPLAQVASACVASGPRWATQLQTLFGQVNQLAAALRAKGGTVVWIKTSADGADQFWSHYHRHMLTPERSARRPPELARGHAGSAMPLAL